jgi:AcrR family transcriptional regulator
MPAHPTQEQRRAETRAKVLDAAIRSLIENGYARSTTRTVAALARVSPGAMAHYFPRRVDLVAAAMERLVDERIATWQEAVDGLSAESESVAALLDHAWEDFSGPAFGVFVKVWTAAADEPELYERLALSEERISRSITKRAVAIFRDAAPEGWEGWLLVTLAAVRGLALTEHFEPRRRRHPDPWPIARAALLRSLEADRR